VTVGSLFAGIGGFDLGFKRAGFEIKWQVEIDDYANRVLAKHWPNVKRYGDIRVIDWSTVEPVDVVCGGFPCQPHSTAGRRMASADERDLWPEYLRCIRALKPRGLRWVVGENVAGLLSSDDGRFFGGILRDLAESGFRVEWDCIPASAVGAPHQRDRVWIVADANGSGSQGWQREELRERAGERVIGPSRSPLAYTNRIGQRGQGRDAAIEGGDKSDDGIPQRDDPWSVEPNVGRVAHGVPARVDRLRGLGNAVVPQIPEWIAHRIKEAEGLTA